MKKKAKKQVLARETVVLLGGVEVRRVAGGTWITVEEWACNSEELFPAQTYCPCPKGYHLN